MSKCLTKRDLAIIHVYMCMYKWQSRDQNYFLENIPHREANMICPVCNNSEQNSSLECLKDEKEKTRMDLAVYECEHSNF